MGCGIRLGGAIFFVGAFGHRTFFVIGWYRVSDLAYKSIMIITEQILDDLSARARASERLRCNLDLRNSTEDKSQRMLNALEPGTVMPIHRHRDSSETVVIVRGKIQWVFYDENGNETERVVLDADGLFPECRYISRGIH